MPIKDASGDVVGVAQVINKLNGERFTENDEKVSEVLYIVLCSRVSKYISYSVDGYLLKLSINQNQSYLNA